MGSVGSRTPTHHVGSVWTSAGRRAAQRNGAPARHGDRIHHLVGSRQLHRTDRGGSTSCAPRRELRNPTAVPGSLPDDHRADGLFATLRDRNVHLRWNRLLGSGASGYRDRYQHATCQNNRTSDEPGDRRRRRLRSAHHQDHRNRTRGRPAIGSVGTRRSRPEGAAPVARGRALCVERSAQRSPLPAVRLRCPRTRVRCVRVVRRDIATANRRPRSAGVGTGIALRLLRGVVCIAVYRDVATLGPA